MISDSDRSEGAGMPSASRALREEQHIAEAVAAYKVELAEKVRALIPWDNDDMECDFARRVVLLQIVRLIEDPAPPEGRESR